MGSLQQVPRGEPRRLCLIAAICASCRPGFLSLPYAKKLDQNEVRRQSPCSLGRTSNLTSRPDSGPARGYSTMGVRRASRNTRPPELWCVSPYKHRSDSFAPSAVRAGLLASDSPAGHRIIEAGGGQAGRSTATRQSNPPRSQTSRREVPACRSLPLIRPMPVRSPDSTFHGIWRTAKKPRLTLPWQGGGLCHVKRVAAMG